MRGTIHQLSVSRGGVPKRAINNADLGPVGLAGDAQRDRNHGGPDRAVCVFSLDVIERLRAEGHPIVPGAVGENITITGLDWSAVAPGGRMTFDGGAEIEITTYTTPCSTIRDAFKNLEFRRIKQDLHPGESRVYARVIRSGALRTGEGVAYRAPAPPAG